MSNTTLNTCGCCAGLDAETPLRIDNPPGLDAVAYRVGVHARFKESLLAKLSSAGLPALAGLTTREDNDFTIALCDAVASTLDVLSFYQERIANENFLRTATERRSILELARLIGYELAPGVAASTWLAFNLQEVPGMPALAADPVTIPVGVKVQSVPGQDELPQTFETVEPVEARVEWNAIPARTTLAWRPKFGDKSLWLAGVSTGVQAGDVILIVGQHRLDNPGSERWDIRLVTRVTEDKVRQRTRIEWGAGLGSVMPHVEPAGAGAAVYVFRQRAALFGHNAPDPRLMDATTGSKLKHLVTGSGVNQNWLNYSILGKQIDLDAAYAKILPESWLALVSNEASANPSGLAGYVELYRANAVSFPSRRDYGLSGKITRIEPDTDENLDVFRYRLRENLVLAQSEALAVAETPLGYPLYGETLALSRLEPDIAAGRALAVSGRRARIRLRAGKPDAVLSLTEGDSQIISEGDSLRLAGQPEEQSGTAWTVLAPADFAARINQSSSKKLRLSLLDREGGTGTLEIAASAIELAPALDDDETVQEIAFIDDLATAVVHDRDLGFTRLTLASALIHCYDRDTARVNANVARASHGETVAEVLGSGDARLANARFALRQSPLTYVIAATPSGRRAAFELRANDMLWAETPSLYARGSDERVYEIRHADDGTSSVRFGNGIEGSRLPSGDHNIRAVYRKGLGLGGNVAAGKLTTLLSRPLGVSGAINPEAANGGEDAEHEARARENAPLTVLTLERAVSIRDYQDFARAFAGIAKAHALWIPSGPGRGVFITVAGENGAALLETSDTYRFLQDALHRYGDPLMPVRIVSYRDARFKLRLTVKVAADADAPLVLVAVESRLREAFGFDARRFGQGVSVDEVAAEVHAIAGVEAVQVVELHRSEAALPVFVPRLFAALPEAGLTGTPLAAELLVLDAAPVTMELMS
jgi:hypothetical protein